MMTDQQVQEFYDSIAEDYDTLRFSKPYFQRIDRFERAYVLGKVRSGASVLEIGPGTGRFTAQLVQKASSVTAIDVSAKMLEQLRQKVPSVRLTTHHLGIEDAATLSNSGEFDTVVCMHVLSHLEHPIPALKIMGEAVKGGGNVVFDLMEPSLFSWCNTQAVQASKSRPDRVLHLPSDVAND